MPYIHHLISRTNSRLVSPFFVGLESGIFLFPPKAFLIVDAAPTPQIPSGQCPGPIHHSIFFHRGFPESQSGLSVF